MHRILFIDAYDSFSNNIASLLQSQLGVGIELIQIDDARFVLNNEAFLAYLAQFDGVVVGPGPGHPSNKLDTGLIQQLWHLPDDHVLPVLGICLGFQSLCLAFGAQVVRLQRPRHGLVTDIAHVSRDIFTHTGPIKATLYHSLCVQLGDRHISDGGRELWESWNDLRPLAWDLSDPVNGPILMGVGHSLLPFWGVQYHPESICTSAEGRQLFGNWWKQAKLWNQRRQRMPQKFVELSPDGAKACFENKSHTLDGNEILYSCDRPAKRILEWTKVAMQCKLDVARVVDLFNAKDQESKVILMESGQRNNKPINSETGRFSILGFHDDSSTHIRYSTATREVVVESKDSSERIPCNIAGVYKFLADFMDRHRAEGGPEEVPFWGGLVGFLSYEAGLEGIGVSTKAAQPDKPDVWFVFVQRSIVVNHVSKTVYLQTIRDNDRSWLLATERILAELSFKIDNHTADRDQAYPRPRPGILISAPEQDAYCEKIQACQKHLRAGRSYELCLTDQTVVHFDLDGWGLYHRLRQMNPAPFGAYFRFEGCRPNASLQTLDVASSSPERFLSWSRKGRCQFRPIKGTVKKGHNVDRAFAEQVLASPKEQAENLMIVDLIRHDLNGVARCGSVHVPKLMVIEEYETVFQLVSVIEGDLDEGNSGISALAASLPPGSMTGAPKKRSCEILHKIEGPTSVRGLYSGVIGYLDVGGGGDFSVVIRTAFRWADGDWHVGAGGAITVLSEQDAEFEEMVTKREALLRALNVVGEDS